MQRAHSDVQTPCGILCTQVMQPDQDGYKKLTRVIKYFRRRRFLRLTLEADHLDQAHWYIVSAFAVHDDIQSHSGSFMTMGKGMINWGSTKSKINTTSSPKAEMVAVHDNLPAMLGTLYILADQVNPLKPTITHQDNQSSILMETNGRASSSKWTRQMNVFNFFIADCPKHCHAEIRYFSNEDMVGDFLQSHSQDVSSESYATSL